MPGVIAKTATQVISIGNIITKTKVIANPIPKIAKSTGVKKPSIN